MGSALSPQHPSHLCPGWTVVKTFSRMHSRAKPACHIVIEVLHRDSHGSVSCVAAFKYLKTVLLPPSLLPTHLPFSKPKSPCS